MQPRDEGMRVSSEQRDREELPAVGVTRKHQIVARAERPSIALRLMSEEKRDLAGGGPSTRANGIRG